MALIPTKTAIGGVQSGASADQVLSGGAIPVNAAGFLSQVPKLTRPSTMPPWLANGVVLQLPQNWILGFTDFPSAEAYMIGAFGLEPADQLWWGYCAVFLTPEFTIYDIFTVVVAAHGQPTLYVWVNRNTLPYANYILAENFGLQATSRSGPIVPASELDHYAVDSTAGTHPIVMQYVQYVPDVTISSGSTAWTWD